MDSQVPPASPGLLDSQVPPGFPASPDLLDSQVPPGFPASPGLLDSQAPPEFPGSRCLQGFRPRSDSPVPPESPHRYPLSVPPNPLPLRFLSYQASGLQMPAQESPETALLQSEMKTHEAKIFSS